MEDLTMLRQATVCNGDELHIDLWYPDVPDSRIKKIVVGLENYLQTPQNSDNKIN